MFRCHVVRVISNPHVASAQAPSKLRSARQVEAFFRDLRREGDAPAEPRLGGSLAFPSLSPAAIHYTDVKGSFPWSIKEVPRKCFLSLLKANDLPSMALETASTPSRWSHSCWRSSVRSAETNDPASTQDPKRPRPCGIGCGLRSVGRSRRSIPGRQEAGRCSGSHRRSGNLPRGTVRSRSFPHRR